jgi:hypothetical protein
MKCLRYGVTVWNFGYLPHTPPGRLCSWRRSPIKPLCRGRTIFPVRSREPRNPKTVKRWGVQFIFVAATGFAAAVRCVSSSRRWAASQPVVINFISTCPSPARCSEFGPPIARYFDLTHCRSIASGNLGEWPGGRRCPVTPTGPAKPQAWRNPSGWRRLRCRPLVAKSAPDTGRYPRPEPIKYPIRNEPICGIIRFSGQSLLCGAYYVELRPSEVDDAEGTSA